MAMIGYISASIPGDVQYAERIEVHTIEGRTDKLRILKRSSMPVGGMDGARDKVEWTTDAETHSEGDTPNKLAASTVQVIKRLIPKSTSLVGRYGTPSKRFVWMHGDEDARGLSTASALKIIKDL